MNAHDVRLGEQLVQFPVLDAVLGGKGFGPAGIGPEEAGFEPGHPGSHAAPDVAEADDAHGLAADFTAHGPGLFPLPGPHGVVALRHVAQVAEQQREGMFRHGHAVRAGRIAKQDAAPEHGWDIDHVQPGAELGDQLEVGELFQQLVGDGQAVAGDGDVGGGQRFNEAGRIHALPAPVQHFQAFVIKQAAHLGVGELGERRGFHKNGMLAHVRSA